MIKFETLRKIKIYFSKLILIILKFNFSNYGKKATIVYPFKIIGSKNISIGKSVFVGENSWLEVLNCNEKGIKLCIDDKTYIGRFCHIMAKSKVIIQKNVLIADKVYISDHSHTYKDISIPYKNQGVIDIGEVSVGEGTWIGENASVIGASIGKQ